MIFDNFPYTNFHELNLDWILHKLKEMDSKLDNFVDLNAVKYHDPIGWDITTQYAQNEIVKDPNTGILYMAKQPVPQGIALTNGDYWLEIGDMSYDIDFLKEAIAIPDEGTAVISANAYSAGDVIWWQDKLYKVTANINQSDPIAEGTNVEQISIGEFITDTNDNLAQLNTDIQDVAGDLQDLADYVNIVHTDKFIIIGDSYLNEINHPNNILTYLKQFFGLTVGTDLWESAVSGNGFAKKDGGNTDGNGFLQQLETYDNVIPKEEITKIIVLGGMNDRHDIDVNGVNSNTIAVAIDNFCAYCRTNFPNAKVFIGQVGCSREVAVRRLLRSVTWKYCEGSARNKNAVYIMGSDYCLKDYSKYDNANHPNSAGFLIMAKFIANAIKNGGSGKMPAMAAQLQSNIDAYGDGSAVTSQTFNSMCFNSTVRVNLGGALTYTLASPITSKLINNTRYKVGILDTNRCFGIPFNSQYQPCNCMVILSDNTEMNCDYAFFHFEEENGDVVFRPLIHWHNDTNVTIKALRFYSGSMMFDVTEV